jgi:hypothetical protein
VAYAYDPSYMGEVGKRTGSRLDLGKKKHKNINIIYIIKKHMKNS